MSYPPDGYPIGFIAKTRKEAAMSSPITTRSRTTSQGRAVQNLLVLDLLKWGHGQGAPVSVLPQEAVTLCLVSHSRYHSPGQLFVKIHQADPETVFRWGAWPRPNAQRST